MKKRFLLTLLRVAAVATTASVIIYARPAPSKSAAAAGVDVNLAKQLEAWRLLISDSLSGKALAAALAKLAKADRKPEDWVLAGDVFAQMQRESGEVKRFDDAEIAYQHALYDRPTMVDALTGMAWVTGGRHDFPTSMEWANKAISQDPQCSVACGILGDAALELGEYDDAMDHYQKMIDLKPDLSSWSRGAHLLWLLGDKSKGIALMTKAVNAGGPFAENTAWCRAKLANMLFLDGAYLPAETVIAPCMKAPTKNIHILLLAAKLAAAKQNFTAAASHYDAILALGPNLEALAGKGDLLAIQDRTSEAEAYYSKVQVLHEQNKLKGVHDHGFIAKFYADHDRNLPDALRMAEEHKQSKNLHEQDTLAWACFKNGQMPKAVAAMKRALAHKTPDPQLHFHAACIAEAFGDKVSASKHLEQAAQMSPQFDLRIAGLISKKQAAIERCESSCSE